MVKIKTILTAQKWDEKLSQAESSVKGTYSFLSTRPNASRLGMAKVWSWIVAILGMGVELEDSVTSINSSLQSINQTLSTVSQQVSAIEDMQEAIDSLTQQVADLEARVEALENPQE